MQYKAYVYNPSADPVSDTTYHPQFQENYCFIHNQECEELNAEQRYQLSVRNRVLMDGNHAVLVF